MIMSKNSSIKTHARFLSAELVSISDRHYFHYNSKSYILTKEQLDKVLLEIKNMNPLSAIKHLIGLVDNFKKITA